MWSAESEGERSSRGRAVEEVELSAACIAEGNAADVIADVARNAMALFGAAPVEAWTSATASLPLRRAALVREGAEAAFEAALLSIANRGMLECSFAERRKRERERFGR